MDIIFLLDVRSRATLLEKKLRFPTIMRTTRKMSPTTFTHVITIRHKFPKVNLYHAQLDLGPVRTVGHLKLPMVRMSWVYYYEYSDMKMVHSFYMRKLIKNRKGYYFEVIMGTNTPKYNQLTGNVDAPHVYNESREGYDGTPPKFQEYLKAGMKTYHPDTGTYFERYVKKARA